MKTPTVAELFEQRATDKCGGYRCPLESMGCSCRIWAMERADPAIRAWAAERDNLFNRSTLEADKDALLEVGMWASVAAFLAILWSTA